MIKGITNEIYYGTKEKPSLAQYVTADSDDGAINVNTAPKMVLRSLAEGISPELADKWMNTEQEKAMIYLAPRGFRIWRERQSIRNCFLR